MRPFLASLGNQGLLSMENRLWKSCDILKLSQPFLKSKMDDCAVVQSYWLVCVTYYRSRSNWPGQDCLNLGSHEIFWIAVTIFSICSLATLKRNNEGLYTEAFLWWQLAAKFWYLLSSERKRRSNQYPVTFNQRENTVGQFFTCSWFKLHRRN